MMAVQSRVVNEKQVRTSPAKKFSYFKVIDFKFAESKVEDEQSGQEMKGVAEDAEGEFYAYLAMAND